MIRRRAPAAAAVHIWSACPLLTLLHALLAAFALRAVWTWRLQPRSRRPRRPRKLLPLMSCRLTCHIVTVQALFPWAPLPSVASPCCCLELTFASSGPPIRYAPTTGSSSIHMDWLWDQGYRLHRSRYTAALMHSSSWWSSSVTAVQRSPRGVAFESSHRWLFHHLP